VYAPEYGGEIRLHTSGEELPKKRHFKVDFTDGHIMTIRLKSMGGILALDDKELVRSWAYTRDMEGGMSPLDEKEFTFQNLFEALHENNKGMKTLLVGKDAVVVGFGNAAYQEIIFHAKIHPKRKGLDLEEKEVHSQYGAIREVVKKRIAKKGKDQFVDLYGNPGKHELIMGSNFRDQPCPRCGTPITRAAMGGGHVHFCSVCQIPR
ncbi:MAG: zinc finger domain-containing protein, partial [Candidatus Thorarchaeota archaeon]